MTILIEAAHCVLIDDEADAREYVLNAFDALRQTAGTRRETSKDMAVTDDRRACRGGLSGWQARRLALHIDTHLSERLLCKDLAHLVNLSIAHFIRAFKATFGCSPHVYLMRRRMERAQGLMLTTDAPLGQIALDCGFADQAHLSRLFKQMLGDSPAAWRRARAVSGTFADGGSGKLPSTPPHQSVLI
jgi:transcriptional regulator GlxA family with amidase domain